MNPWMAVIAGLIGYLLGSISSARLVTGRVAPGTNISRVEEPIPNSDQKFIMESVSATNVRVQVGTRYGCLTAILDMLKVALPTLALRLLFPPLLAAREVWMSMLVTWNGEQGKIVAKFTPEMAVDIAGMLVKASDGARVHIKETIDVGNRADFN